MGILGNLFSKRKSEPAFDKDLPSAFGDNSKLGMDTGMPGDSFGDDKALGMPPSEGLPDLSTYRGIGEPRERAQMEQTLSPRQEASSAFNSFQQQQQPMQQQVPVQSHEIEVVTAKLDAIRATLDAINQRIANIERLQYANQEEQKKNRW